MPTIRVKENEPFEVALRRLKRTIEKSGLLTELRAREFYEKPTAERKRKKAAAIKRHYKRLRSMMLPMLVIFLNPLTMGVIARLVGTNVYGDCFEILFNPFTDLIFFIAIYHTFEWQPLGQWVLELCLIAAVLIGHGASWLDLSQGLYTDYIRDDAKLIVHDTRTGS